MVRSTGRAFMWLSATLLSGAYDVDVGVTSLKVQMEFSVVFFGHVSGSDSCDRRGWRAFESRPRHGRIRGQRVLQ